MENSEQKKVYRYEKKRRMKLMRSVFSHIGFSLFAYDLVATALVYGVTMALAYCFVATGNRDKIAWLLSAQYSWLSTAVFQFGIATCVFLLIMKIKKPIVKEALPKRRLKVGAAVLVGIVCIAIMQFGAYISTFVSNWVEALRGNPLESELNLLIMDSNIFSVFIMCVVIGPILEEIIFRRCIIDRMRPFGEWFAVICSAIIFGIAHGNFMQLFYSFGIGIMLGVLYAKTNNLKICIGYHMFLNFTGTIIPMIFMMCNPENSMTMIMYMIYLFILFILTITGITLIAVFAKRIKLERCKIEGLELSDKIKAFVLNPGMILVFLTAIGAFIMSF